MKGFGAKSYLILENDFKGYNESSNMQLKTKKNEKRVWGAVTEQE